MKPIFYKYYYHKFVNLMQKVKYNLIKRNWENIEYFDDAWKKRIKLMASFIPNNKTITDLGCGKMWLKEYIKDKNIKYIPVDYKNRGDNTIICDFNKQEFPNNKSDIAFVSGCLEYVNNPEWFVNKISENNNLCIISYCTTDYYDNMTVRKANAWKNNLSKNDIINLFDKGNMFLINETVTKTKNTIFIFKKS